MFKYAPPAIKNSLVAASLVLSAFGLNAHAALTSYNSNGVDLVYSSVSDVTWTKDANLFKTMYDADNTLVTKIAAVTPSYNDPNWGLQTISDGSVGGYDYDDFNTSNDTYAGTMSWWGAFAFVNYLNSINYAGSNQWYLPPVANPIQGYNTPTNGTAKGDELVELFYQELGGTPYSSIPNTATFDNEKNYLYWSATQNAAPRTWSAWMLAAHSGWNSPNSKTVQQYVWAVSPGQIAAVPEPEFGAMLLMGFGLVGFVSRRKTKPA